MYCRKRDEKLYVGKLGVLCQRYPKLNNVLTIVGNITIYLCCINCTDHVVCPCVLRLCIVADALFCNRNIMLPKQILQSNYFVSAGRLRLAFVASGMRADSDFQMITSQRVYRYFLLLL